MSHYWSAPANQRPVLGPYDQSEASIYEKRAGDTWGLSETSPSRPLPGCLYTTQTPESHSNIQRQFSSEDILFWKIGNINTIYNISDWWWLSPQFNQHRWLQTGASEDTICQVSHYSYLALASSLGNNLCRPHEMTLNTPCPVTSHHMLSRQLTTDTEF